MFRSWRKRRLRRQRKNLWENLPDEFPVKFKEWLMEGIAWHLEDMRRERDDRA